MATPSSKPIPYTANPLLLMLNDLMLFAEITITWPITAGLPSIVLPLCPTRSGSLDELAVTGANARASFLHIILIVAQIFFLGSLFPLAFIVMPSLYLLYVVAFVMGNKWFTALLNGPRQRGLFESNPACMRGKARHEHEKWVFINGVAVGRHWLQSNLDRLAMTFRRPIFGIHNQTRGIIFDVLECIIQRDLNFATLDIRTAYAAMVEILSDDNIQKVVLILHSQGAIEGGLVLDWLYDTVPADQLGKLEVYTFGNAANHWNAPVISSSAISSAIGDSVTEQRIVSHIEHYANEGDYVSRFGILHFRPDQQSARTPIPGKPPLAPSSRTPYPDKPKPTDGESAHIPRSNPPKINTRFNAVAASSRALFSPKTPIEMMDLREEETNRFFGRLFKRIGSGHQLNQHYLDNMFEMEGIDTSDLSRGRVRDNNAFMDSEIDMGIYQDWDTVQAVGRSGVRQNGRPVAPRKQIKDLSRLWAYRNGQSPEV
ncbi:uncharacterized protein Z519_07550 [Cladophialophora bantiana CBS 173.52]|uniref:DUF676 domain-containing protein n=1 Tax=Cladophialophora bantiana (strain ATCC 10958 / CBS 173.52 / CDC B-1940 / NIH 8579) TaxID=1442370 RepID=A0A0D2HE74_CLAB1|nr:uncharacterized protein Z519_07550 [Cladophialophora bantiana CBS 173.52]KIW91583.1 hypothetical protein Z519_07550 [Cladophialophora bantiana CBS 173.52]